MHPNPFSPSFSAIPGTFFGRDSILEGMRDAVSNPASPYRLLFFTGTRGSGKSSLMHELAEIAREAKWQVIETSSTNASADVRSELGQGSLVRKAIEAKPSLTQGGTTLSAGGLSYVQESSNEDTLSRAIIHKIQRLKLRNGLFIAVDEIQSTDKETVQQLCAAMQASRAQGLPLIVVLCGLPGSYEKICGWRGCTYVMRMRYERIGVLDEPSTRKFMEAMFAKVPEVGLTETLVDRLVSFSQGQPFLMHLTGYYLCEIVKEAYDPKDGTAVTIDDGILQDAKIRAFEDYRRQVLLNVLRYIRKGTRTYIERAARALVAGEEPRSDAILQAMGLSGQAAARVEAQAVKSQVVEIDESGTVFFTVPYFAELFNENRGDSNKKLPRTRQLLD